MVFSNLKFNIWERLQRLTISSKPSHWEGGRKCPTKSEITALGLVVNGTYGDNQLVQESDIIQLIDYTLQFTGILSWEDGYYQGAIYNFRSPVHQFRIDREVSSENEEITTVDGYYRVKAVKGVTYTISVIYTQLRPGIHPEGPKTKTGSVTFGNKELITIDL